MMPRPATTWWHSRFDAAGKQIAGEALYGAAL
jgi:hypothetical protein